MNAKERAEYDRIYNKKRNKIMSEKIKKQAEEDAKNSTKTTFEKVMDFLDKMFSKLG